MYVYPPLPRRKCTLAPKPRSSQPKPTPARSKAKPTLAPTNAKPKPKPTPARPNPKPTPALTPAIASLAPAKALAKSRLWPKPTPAPAPANSGTGQTKSSGQGQAPRGMMTGKKLNKLRNLELNRRWPPMQPAGNNPKCKNNESKMVGTTQFAPGRISEQ